MGNYTKVSVTGEQSSYGALPIQPDRSSSKTYDRELQVYKSSLGYSSLYPMKSIPVILYSFTFNNITKEDSDTLELFIQNCGTQKFEYDSKFYFFVPNTFVKAKDRNTYRLRVDAQEVTHA